MNQKGSLYAIIGGCVGAVLTLAVCSVMPLGAQNGDAMFGEITCTALKVVDIEGNDKVVLSASPFNHKSGFVIVYGGEASVYLQADRIRPRMGIIDKWGNVTLSVDNNGGTVDLSDRNRTRLTRLGAD